MVFCNKSFTKLDMVLEMNISSCLLKEQLLNRKELFILFIVCAEHHKVSTQAEHKSKKDAPEEAGKNNIAAQTFTFRELASATKNFRQECLVGEGGFGRVYKGKLEHTGQVNKAVLVWLQPELLSISTNRKRKEKRSETDPHFEFLWAFLMILLVFNEPNDAIKLSI